MAGDGRRGERGVEDLERRIRRFTAPLCQEARRRAASGPRFPSHSKLFRTNRDAAVRHILQGPSPPCLIPREELQRHFTRAFARGDEARPGAPRPASLRRLPRLPSAAGLGERFTPGEVRAIFPRAKNKRPGPDGISLDLLKEHDPTGESLAAIFEGCRQLRHTPAAWKRAQTGLKPKRGDPGLPGSWRPIFYCNAIYKLYAKCLAERVTAWARAGGALSPQQKALRGPRGVAELRFLLQSVLHKARRSGGRECALAWLDLEDAYGSVRHCHVLDTLAEFGMPGDFLGLLRELQEGWTTTIKVGQEETEEIPLRTGLMQGCPLSSILFHLAMEPLLRFVDGRARGFNLYGERISVLAYADDLVLIAENAEELRAALDDASAAADWIGLRFKAGKCKSLHVRCGTHQETTFAVQGRAIPCLKEGETVQYLGKPIGFQEQPASITEEFEAKLEKIEASRLGTRQKVSMVQVTLVREILSVVREQLVPKKELRWIDSQIESVLGSYQIDPELTMEELCDIEVVTHAFLLLSSPDEVIRNVAHEALRIIVHENFIDNPAQRDLAAYLSGFCKEEDYRSNRSSTCLWTRARYASRRLDKLVGFRWIDNGELGLELSGDVMSPKKLKTLVHTLRSAVKSTNVY